MNRSFPSMGIAIIESLIIPTVITLVVIPVVFEYIGKFRDFVERCFRIPDEENEETIGKWSKRK